MNRIYRIVDFGTSRGVMLCTWVAEHGLAFMAWRAWKHEPIGEAPRWEIEGQRTDESAVQAAERKRRDGECFCSGDVKWDGCSEVCFDESHACQPDEWTKIGFMFEAIFNDAKQVGVEI